MKIQVVKRFSIKEGRDKLKFYEVKNVAQDIDEINGEKAIALGYAKEVDTTINKETNNK